VNTAELLGQSRYGSRRRRRRNAPMTPEGEIKKTIRQGLTLLRIPHYGIGVGCFPVQNADGSTRFVQVGDPGVPDLVALVPGIGTVWIEVKSKRGRMRPEQVEFRDACRKAGIVHVVATSFEDLTPWLRPGRGA